MVRVLDIVSCDIDPKVKVKLELSEDLTIAPLQCLAAVPCGSALHEVKGQSVSGY